MILSLTYDLQMLPESPVQREGIEDILSKLMEQFEHCKPLATCFFLKVVAPEHVTILYNELEDIATTLHDGAIASLHFVMTPVEFENDNFQYQFLKAQSACVRTLFGFGDVVDGTAEIE